MTVVPLTSMPAAGALTGSELFYIQQSAADAKATISQVLAVTGATNNSIGVSDPPTTTSVSTVMAGLGTATYGPAASITPIRTGTVLFHIMGNLSQVTVADTTFCHLRYGTGTAPVNGAAQTGTGLTASVNVSNTISMPFCVVGVAVGLTLSTAYWYDLGFSVNAGTGQILNQTCCAVEL